ncbi:MAG: deoxyribonuclease IV [Deltaproteobacteria bacterium RIFCSPHIGHO2_12_FULL_43_9]|nr:MAG: deoxyribonuclease IV [Deltaproteobacteria bacterium RIFCSPHIGHO2_12_FULL_43_9]
MPLFGAHISTSGGVEKSIERAIELNCEAIQIFTKNNNQWNGKPLTEESIKAFKDGVKKAKIKVTNSHDSYLINLCSTDKNISKKSHDAFLDELNRAEELALDYVVMHPGAHLGKGESAGLKTLTRAFNNLMKETRGYKVLTLIESTAGQGSNIGYKFEHLKEILDGVTEPERFGVCLDTCHLYAAGYDISTKDGYEKTFSEFNKIVGIKQIKMFHLNDSKRELASRVDRHEHIGEGKIGRDGFKFLVNDQRFKNHAMIIETPKEDDFMKFDSKNLNFLKSLLKERIHVAHSAVP